MTWNQLSVIFLVVPFLTAPIIGTALIVDRKAHKLNLKGIRPSFAPIIGAFLIIIGLYSWWLFLSYFLK